MEVNRSRQSLLRDTVIGVVRLNSPVGPENLTSRIDALKASLSSSLDVGDQTESRKSFVVE